MFVNSDLTDLLSLFNARGVTRTLMCSENKVDALFPQREA